MLPMSRFASFLFVVLAIVPSAFAAAPAKLSFNEHIQPVLAEYCYHCHGVDSGSRKAGLRLNRAEFALKPLEKSGPAIVPGKPDESPLIQRIESTDEKKRMPPAEAHKTLSPEHIALLRQWIAEGAEYEEHWAFITPKRAPVPKIENRKAKIENPIDAFVQARLAKEKLTPAPEADRRALIRRVTLDLTGVIPTAAEVDAFVADKSPDAYGSLVDRLLASPRWGEHRTRYWLDYVRYADTHGIHFDNYRAIWPYRDYVVRAFNANKPFDAFVREQLAGDLLPARTFLPHWARGVQIFGNLSSQRALGDATANFAGFIPRSGSWGASLTRDRVKLHLNWNYRGRARRGAVATGSSIEPGTYQWGNTRLVTDLIVEYRVWKRVAVFANLRNLTHAYDELEIAGPSTPEVARLRQVNADFGSLWTMGVKGTF
jgi:hypothetical protein